MHQHWLLDITSNLLLDITAGQLSRLKTTLHSHLRHVKVTGMTVYTGEQLVKN